MGRDNPVDLRPPRPEPPEVSVRRWFSDLGRGLYDPLLILAEGVILLVASVAIIWLANKLISHGIGKADESWAHWIRNISNAAIIGVMVVSTMRSFWRWTRGRR